MANSSDASSLGGVKKIQRGAKRRVAGGGDSGAPNGASRGWFNAGISIRERDLAVVLRQLIMLLEAGTPLLKSLKTLSERSDKASVRALLTDITQHVEMGNPLWQAFDRHPKMFDAVFVNLIKASEASGTLVPVLERITSFREKRNLLRRRIQGAMIYPLLVLAVCYGVIALIGRFVLPEFASIFDKLEQGIPKTTEMFMKVTAGFTDPVIVGTVVGAVVVLVLLYRLLVRRPLWRMRFDHLKLYIPILGKGIIRKHAIVEMTRSLSLLLSSGLSMMATLELVRNAIHNKRVAQVMQDIRDSVEKGEGIEKPLRAVPGIVPPVVTDMLVTGEESGQLDKISGQIAETYEQEVNIGINTIAELIPPVLAVGMGVFVLALALAVFLPLIDMLGSLQSGQ